MSKFIRRIKRLERSLKPPLSLEALLTRRAEDLTDRELVYIITGDAKVRPEDISDEDLARLAAGESWPLDR